MLSFRQLDDLPHTVVDIWAQTQQEIINDMARRIARLGRVTDATMYQEERLHETGAAMANVQKELAKALHITNKQMGTLFDEAATRTLATDDRIYRAAGLDPIPLANNPAMQQIIWAGMEKTMGEFTNLTRTTANTAMAQFRAALDLAHQRIVTGAFDYKSSIKMAIKSLSEKGIASVQYPGGRMDYIDVATRRAVLTGVSQTAAKLQEHRFKEMGAKYVETTAHAGARSDGSRGPSDHAWWQGKVYYWNHTGVTNTTGYPDFIEATGYGTGEGLCGWNCRHSFYPYYPGVSEMANTREQIDAMNNKAVTYNGKPMSLYEATQHQRHIERQIRRWKRESGAMAAAGLDNGFAKNKIAEWQGAQRNFVLQTGLRRDYFRERGGIQLVGSAGHDILSDISANRHQITLDSLSKVPTYTLQRYDGALLRGQQIDLLKSLIGTDDITEASVFYALDGKRLAGGVGADGHAPIYRVKVPYVSIHNHPSGLTFSNRDIEHFVFSEYAAVLAAVGNNGASYVLEKLHNFDTAGFIKNYTQAISSSTKLNAEKYVKHIEDILKGAGKYGFRYYR